MTFEEAVIEVKSLPSQSNENLLKLYALFKQATEGDAALGMDFDPFDVVNKTKYDSWSSLRGLSAEDAKNQYVTLVESLKK